MFQGPVLVQHETESLENSEVTLFLWQISTEIFSVAFCLCFSISLKSDPSELYISIQTWGKLFKLHKFLNPTWQMRQALSLIFTSLLLSVAVADVCKDGEIGIGTLETIDNGPYTEGEGPQQTSLIVDHYCKLIEASSKAWWWLGGFTQAQVQAKETAPNYFVPTNIQTKDGSYNNCYQVISNDCNFKDEIDEPVYLFDTRINYCCRPYRPSPAEQIRRLFRLNDD